MIVFLQKMSRSKNLLIFFVKYLVISKKSSTFAPGFERDHYMVAIAQLAEHRIVVPSVVGSSPTSHPKETTYGRLFLYFQAKYLHTCNIFTTFAAKIVCGISTSVVHRLPKPRRRVRFPYAALRVRQQGRNDCRLRH